VCSAPRFVRFFEWLPLTPEPFEGASRMNLTDVTPNLIVSDIDRSTAFDGMREFGIQDPDGYVTFFAQRIA
jgi:hypothetical protein